ncbi:hypothetical protein ACFVRD_38555 [Streptomyces sp. NPDC057908]|uniref:hypothetical protein n=1 Tax=Streptomyces sp. NPDC057908 TaxID=3346276 RepID=UPI0036E67960
MKQRHARAGLGVTAARGNQAVRGTDAVDAVDPIADDGDVALDSGDYPLDGPLVRGLDRRPRLLIPRAPTAG